MAENALVQCNVHCRQVQLLSHGYTTSIPRQSIDTSVPNPNLYHNPNPTLTVLIPLQLPARTSILQV